MLCALRRVLLCYHVAQLQCSCEAMRHGYHQLVYDTMHRGSVWVCIASTLPSKGKLDDVGLQLIVSWLWCSAAALYK